MCSHQFYFGERPQTPPPTDYDGEESFVVLGRSPTSFTFNENANSMLRDALQSLGDEQIAATEIRHEEKKEVTNDVAKDTGVGISFCLVRKN